ncbi:response regulator [Thiospirochaeta perfilievii]|uniref:Response regulator n=1 Tax=Thiospirochaeta perfilievii TaxID=252967 RepID=A0A5C1QET2_9SPIO|nr:response regulator [Thiospirochaeta perfilievii]QEN04732.1 response regulator [Thiospirochaeta perfilievii]
MKLLIVDDSNIMRRAINKYLKEFKLEIVGSACNGEEAVEICKSKKPDLVTLDITMPKMDGLTCLTEILKIAPETKILVISALSDYGTGLLALKKGAMGFLPKPFTASELQEEIKFICGIMV